MKKRLIYSLFLLFTLFTLGATLTILYIYRTTSNLRTIIALHRVEIIRQNLVINAQTVQSHLYTIGTVFGPDVDQVVNSVLNLDNSVHSCLGCHHTPQMTVRLQEMNRLVEDYKEALSYLITTSANPDRVERLRTAAIGIGNVFLNKSQEMALIANERLNEQTVKAMQQINNSRSILLVTLMLSFCIALVIAVTMTRQITGPINELVDATRRIKAGNLGYITPYKSRGEFGELINSFNDMSLTLKESNEKILRYLHNLSNLYSITITFHSVTSMTDIFKELSAGIEELTGARQSGILLMDEKGEFFRHMYPASGIPREAADSIKIESSFMDSLYHSCMRRALILNRDIQRSPTAKADGQLGVKNIMFIWVRNKGELIGAIRAANKKTGDFTEEDASLLAILGNNFSVALENARLWESLKLQMKELKDTQEQLVQAAKFAAIGELASNVAHEINNPLTSILGYAELIREETDMDIMQRDLDIIEKESLRARDIVNHLLEFSRKRPLKIGPTDINALLKNVMELISFQIKDTLIKIVADFGDIPPIKGDPDQLKQVFLNLVNNAIFAMEKSGALGIKTYVKGNFACVRISDTGKGIPAEVMERIFEPFFTTKSEKGTGLGLSISYKIVQSHRGNFEVESAPGKGSSFTVKLPLGDKPPGERRPAEDKSVAAKGVADSVADPPAKTPTLEN
ncbi:MAG: ATP-binding protein [Nitrospiraceae bacterium]|nr:ATP-binding protein [Nitrospiraceae bacterium]